ncbi:MAG: hypothetical protein WAQ57_01310 [Candidatus Saccharimonadales bacterium]
MAPKKERGHEPVAAHTVHNRTQATAKLQQVAAPAVASASQTEAPAAPRRAGELLLPTTLISRGDLGKCLREVEQINDYFHQSGLRGSKDQPLPTLGHTLESLAQANGLNLIHAEDRDELIRFLTRLKAKAPSVFMSFPSEASDDFIAKLLDWFRAEVHPYVLLNAGLQPELAAGCTLRTTNKFFDFSFRNRLERSKQKLVEALIALDKAADKTVVADATATNQPGALAEGDTSV